ncbi:hypothetical protein DM75_4017 [Burkholderia mallei]|nr:hypothetical protein DM75_4017 [Burkholderia mallei]
MHAIRAMRAAFDTPARYADAPRTHACRAHRTCAPLLRLRRRAAAIERRRAQRLARLREIALPQLRDLRVAILRREVLRIDLRALRRIFVVFRAPRVVRLLHLRDALRRLRPQRLRELRAHFVGRRTGLLQLRDPRDGVVLLLLARLLGALVERQLLLERRETRGLLRIRQRSVAHDSQPREIVALPLLLGAEKRLGPIAERAARDRCALIERELQRREIELVAGRAAVRQLRELIEIRTIAFPDVERLALCERAVELRGDLARDERIERLRAQLALRTQAIVEEIAHRARLREMAVRVERQPRRRRTGQRRGQAARRGAGIGARRDGDRRRRGELGRCGRRARIALRRRADDIPHRAGRDSAGHTVKRDAPRNAAFSLHRSHTLRLQPVRMRADHRDRILRVRAAHAEQLVDLVEVVHL